MRNILTLFLLSLTTVAVAQLKELAPSSISQIDLNAAGEKEFNDNWVAAEKIWERMSNGLKYKELSKEEKETLGKIDETQEGYWEIIGGGCSWYCGGGPIEVAASSYLMSQGQHTYEPQNAHDLNYKNAWVEGVKGYGIGEYLLYTFAAASPRITEIIVVNGYVKSQSAWKDNSRVKKLKMYVDNKPYAILNLKDIRAEQRFSVSPLGVSDRSDWEALQEQPNWTIKFEILEVYKGAKYDDVVISEIYFDGLDVHCFAAGTQVTMADQSTKSIEDLAAGDSVAYWDFTTQRFKSARVEKMEQVPHHELVTYHFESGLSITSTQDHPYLLQNKAWASLKPSASRQYKGFEKVGTIAVGDVFITASGTKKLISIDNLPDHQITYTISKLSAGDNFIANGLVVGVEQLKEEEQ